MTVDQALACVWREAARSSQAMVADAIGVSPATITRWKDGNRPRGVGVAKLLAWAEGLPAVPSPDVLATAIERTGANLVRLAEIRGYAMSVLTMLRAVTDEQQRVVDSLDPWARAEGQELAAKVPEADHESIRDSFRQSAEQPARPSAEQTAPTRRKAAQ